MIVFVDLIKISIYVNRIQTKIDFTLDVSRSFERGLVINDKRLRYFWRVSNKAQIRELIQLTDSRKLHCRCVIVRYLIKKYLMPVVRDYWREVHTFESRRKYCDVNDVLENIHAGPCSVFIMVWDHATWDVMSKSRNQVPKKRIQSLRYL